jgi:hypothetical protein
MFKLSEAHLRLLRQATVLWTPVESGAPAILISPLEVVAAQMSAEAAHVVGDAMEVTP